MRQGLAAEAVLCRLRAQPSDDGLTVRILTTHNSGLERAVNVPFEQLGLISQQLKATSAIMSHRIIGSPSAEHRAVKDLIDTACPSVSTRIHTDTATGDRILLVQFMGLAPVAIRLDYDQAEILAAQILAKSSFLI